MSLDYILWVTVHKDSSAHKLKKIGLSHPANGCTLFPHSNHCAPGCCQQNACPRVISTHLPPSKDPSRLRSPHYSTSHPENWQPRALLSNSGAQTAAGKRGWVGEETQIDLNGPQHTKYSCCAKTELPYAPALPKAKYPPWVSTLMIRYMCSQRFATSGRLSHCLCFRTTLYNCILHNKSVKINSLS